MATAYMQYTGTLNGTVTDVTFTATCTTGHAIGGYCGVVTAGDSNSGHVIFDGPTLSGTGGASGSATSWSCWVGHGSQSNTIAIRYGVLCQ